MVPEVAAQVGRGEITLPEAEKKPEAKTLKLAFWPDEPEAESRNANVGVLADSEPSPASEEPADVASESAPPIGCRLRKSGVITLSNGFLCSSARDGRQDGNESRICAAFACGLLTRQRGGNERPFLLHVTIFRWYLKSCYV